MYYISRVYTYKLIIAKTVFVYVYTTRSKAAISAILDSKGRAFVLIQVELERRKQALYSFFQPFERLNKIQRGVSESGTQNRQD